MKAFDISVQRFDEFASAYASRFMNVDSYVDSLERFCDSFPASNPRILELACGPGNITRYLRKRFPSSYILAIDLAPKMIELARQHVPNAVFSVMDIRRVSDIRETFDLIMCSFGLPFLSNDDAGKLIADCAAMLNSSGRLYVSTMEGSEEDAGYEPTSFSGDSVIYFNYHKLADLEKMFMQSGFRLEYSKRQEYKDPSSQVLIDLILIGVKA